MSSPCFVTQEATEEILLRVTNVCAECYDDIKEGDTIHYDMQNYRYLCQRCQEALCEKMNDECEIIVEESAGLFG
jgi:frataxin-like iron-binding protein CyaY